MFGVAVDCSILGTNTNEFPDHCRSVEGGLVEETGPSEKSESLTLPWHTFGTRNIYISGGRRFTEHQCGHRICLCPAIQMSTTRSLVHQPLVATYEDLAPFTLKQIESSCCASYKGCFVRICGTISKLSRGTKSLHSRKHYLFESNISPHSCTHLTSRNSIAEQDDNDKWLSSP